jgi:glycosyltransferase involved in cell wall biosynthesis
MNKKALTLSIVIPVYNEEDHIGDCLDAIAAQTVKPDEVIVVNNNSTDKSVDIIKRYPFVKLLHEEKQGLRFTRNTGMAAAAGTIIGRIDADVQITPDWCKVALQTFADDSVMAASGPCFYHDMPAKRLGFLSDNSVRRALYSFDEPVLFGSNMVLRKTAWEQVVDKLCTEGEFFEDHDITIHLRDLGLKIVYNQALVVGVSARRLDDDPKTFIEGMKLHTKTFEMHGLKNPVASGGKYIYITSYPLLKSIRKAYDPEGNKMSLKKALKKTTKPRPTANT